MQPQNESPYFVLQRIDPDLRTSFMVLTRPVFVILKAPYLLFRASKQTGSVLSFCQTSKSENTSLTTLIQLGTHLSHTYDFNLIYS